MTHNLVTLKHNCSFTSLDTDSAPNPGTDIYLKNDTVMIRDLHLDQNVQVHEMGTVSGVRKMSWYLSLCPAM